MRKIIGIICVAVFIGLITITPSAIDEIAARDGELNISNLSDYQREFESYDVGVCAANSTKTYMDYRAITNTGSAQYWHIRNHMTVDAATGFLYDEDGFIGVALGSYYGRIGDRFYITLSNGNVLPVVKIDEKSDRHTINGCAHKNDGSVIEFVINTDYARNSFAIGGNGLVSSGNYNNSPTFNGTITKVEKVTDKRNPNYVDYFMTEDIIDITNNYDTKVFNYASGY